MNRSCTTHFCEFKTEQSNCAQDDCQMGWCPEGCQVWLDLESTHCNVAHLLQQPDCLGQTVYYGLRKLFAAGLPCNPVQEHEKAILEMTEHGYSFGGLPEHYEGLAQAGC